MSNKIIVLDTPDQIEAFRLLSIRGRLKLELAGIRFKGGSTFAYVKREFGLRGNRQSVLDQYEKMLRDNGVLKS